jgi:hypothetical protein
MLDYFFGARSDRWYANLFKNARSQGKIAGEVTPAYATLGEAAFVRIRNMNPRMKFVFVMRDPVDRTWSFVNFAAKSLRTVRPLSEEQALQRAHSPGAISRSSYTDTIRRLESVFPEEQIHYCFFDDLIRKPEAFTVKAVEFLGADASAVRNMALPCAINSAAAGRPIPRKIEVTLACEYLSMVSELSDRFGGAASSWRERYVSLISS